MMRLCYVNHFKAAEKRVILESTSEVLLSNGFPEYGTDSKSESFGGPVFATNFPPQRSINTEINPREFRNGETPVNNTFAALNRFQSLIKTFINLISQLFQQQLHRLYSDMIVFCVLIRCAGFQAIRH